MNWSNNEEERTKQVQQAFQELGFEWPSTEEELELYEAKFKGYPHKLKGDEIDPEKILNDSTAEGN